MTESDLQRAVESLHGGRASHRETVEVRETFRGQPVWEGVVHVFDVEGHPEATTAYAWSSPVEGSDRRRFYAVLAIPPVTSPEEAVRASIVADHQEAQIMDREDDSPEEAYRRGYQQGAFAAVEAAERFTTSRRDFMALRRWVETTLYTWRLKNPKDRSRLPPAPPN